jgi:transposase-like protein
MRSNDDKQRAVKAALAHPKCAGLSDNQIAKHVGVNQSTVSAWRKKLDVSYGIHKMDGEATRTVTRNGKTYEMDTSNIGKRAAEPGAVAGSSEIVSGETKKKIKLTGARLTQSQMAAGRRLSEAVAVLDGVARAMATMPIDHAVAGLNSDEVTELGLLLASIQTNLSAVRKRLEEPR